MSEITTHVLTLASVASAVSADNILTIEMLDEELALVPGVNAGVIVHHSPDLEIIEVTTSSGSIVPTGTAVKSVEVSAQFTGEPEEKVTLSHVPSSSVTWKGDGRTPALDRDSLEVTGDGTPSIGTIMYSYTGQGYRFTPVADMGLSDEKEDYQNLIVVKCKTLSSED